MSKKWKNVFNSRRRSPLESFPANESRNATIVDDLMDTLYLLINGPSVANPRALPQTLDERRNDRARRRFLTKGLRQPGREKSKNEGSRKNGWRKRGRSNPSLGALREEKRYAARRDATYAFQDARRKK